MDIKDGMLYILKKTISDAFNKPMETMEEKTNVVTDLQLNEVDLVELAVEIEKVFSVVVDDVNFHEVNTIEKILDLIIKKLEM